MPSFGDDGRLNFFIGRAFKRGVKPKILNEEVEKTELVFNEHLINWDATIYLVEGPFDHLVTPNSIPLLGKILHNNLFLLLQEKASADVVLFMDGDAVDDAKLIYKSLNSANLVGRVRMIILNENYDPSKVYEEFGRKNYLKILSTADTIPYHQL